MDRRKEEHFETLFRSLHPRLFAFCCKYVEDKELARDFVQECFVALWEHYESVSTSYESYLFTAVRNRCLSHFRSLKIQADYATSLRLRIREIELHPTVPDSLIELYLGEINDLTKQSMELLPEKCRLVFHMSRNLGMKNSEIAESLGISTRTVETHIHNALGMIKKLLKDYVFSLFFTLL
jgi:RNA polymerase sigma-70 factor (ECF subfamily)